MWPIPARTSALMVIGFNNNHLVLSTYSQKQKAAHYVLNGYQRIALNLSEYNNGIIFNLTSIKNHIQNFIKIHGLFNATTLITIAGSLFNEQIIVTPQANPSLEELQLIKRQSINNYMYLYSQENGFAFYTYSIKKEHLAQYQLLAIASQLNVSHILIENCARLELYHAVKGSQFRQAELALDLQRNNYLFDSLITLNDMQLLLKIHASLQIKTDDEFSYLTASLGAVVAKNR